MLNSVFLMPLNTYGVVIGWLEVIVSFLATILLSVALGFVDKIAHQIIATNKNSDMTKEQRRNRVVIVLTVWLALRVINLLASALLVVGTVKERHLLLLPWLIFNGVLLGIYIVANLGLWAKTISSSMPLLDALFIILLSSATVALAWYLYYGGYSLFKQIQATSDIQRLLITPGTEKTNSYPSCTKIWTGF